MEFIYLYPIYGRGHGEYRRGEPRRGVDAPYLFSVSSIRCYPAKKGSVAPYLFPASRPLLFWGVAWRGWSRLWVSMCVGVLVQCSVVVGSTRICFALLFPKSPLTVQYCVCGVLRIALTHAAYQTCPTTLLPHHTAHMGRRQGERGERGWVPPYSRFLSKLFRCPLSSAGAGRSSFQCVWVQSQSMGLSVPAAKTVGGEQHNSNSSV